MMTKMSIVPGILAIRRHLDLDMYKRVEFSTENMQRRGRQAWDQWKGKRKRMKIIAV